MGASGVEQNTFASGTQAFSDQAMSRLSVQIMGTENTSFAEQQSLNNAVSISRTKNIAASEATEASLQTSTHFLSQLGTDKFKGEEYTKNLSASEAKSLQNFNNFVKEIQQRKGLDETQAVEAALGVSLGGSVAFLGVDAKGSFSSTAARQQAIQDASSVADQIGYSENAEKVVSAAQSLSEGTRDTTGAELDTGALASLNHAKGLREEASVAQNKVKTLSKDISSSQSKELTISKELTQEVLEFIAHQPANPGPNGASGGQIGYKEARRILESGGEERAAYLNRFQEQNPQYSIQSINVAGARSDLNMQYETQAQHQRKSAGVQAQNASNTQEVQHHAKVVGLDHEKAETLQKDNSIKAAVLEQIKNTGGKIQKGSEEVGKQKQILQDAEKASEEKTLGGTALKNLAVSTGEGLLSTGKDVVKAIEKLPPDYPLIIP